MATVQEIVDKFSLKKSANAPRNVMTSLDKVFHVSDPSTPIEPWDHYRKTAPGGGGLLPDSTVAQVLEVRGMLPTVALPPAKGITLQCESLGCNRAKCYQYRKKEDVKPVVDELHAQAMNLKAQRDAATDPKEKKGKQLEYLKAMAFRLLMEREGPSTAINTYDIAIFTWGMGWAGPSQLPKVLSKIYGLENDDDIEKHYVQKLFYLCGFLHDDGEYLVVDTDKKMVVGGHTPEDRGAAYRLIHDTDELHYMWIAAASDAKTKDLVVKAQRLAFSEGSGSVPQGELIQTAALYTFIAHLQHWGSRQRQVVAFARDPRSKPPLPDDLPSLEGDKILAINAVREFYGAGSGTPRRPDYNANDFNQTRLYWKEMVQLDAATEGVQLDPGYAIMTNPQVDGVMVDHLAGLVAARSTKLWDLGPLEDFHIPPPPDTSGPLPAFLLPDDGTSTGSTGSVGATDDPSTTQPIAADPPGNSHMETSSWNMIQRLF
jgi:hypothetical protein